MRFTAALAQIYPKLGDLKANLNRHTEQMTAARGQGADLIVFPELSLTGYFLQDLLYEVAIRPHPKDPIFGAILQASGDLDLDTVVSFPEVDDRNRFYISAAYLSRGEVLHVHRKVYLPTYGMFVDGRFFTPGRSIRAFDTRFGRLGILICEDFWHLSAPYLLWLDGADLLVFPTDSPGRGISTDSRFGAARWGEMIGQMYSGLLGSYVLYCNRVGFEDGISFFGGSSICDPDGKVLSVAPQFDEALLLQELDLSLVRRARERQPFLRDENLELVSREISRLLAQSSEQE